jgi:hypothetical protein
MRRHVSAPSRPNGRATLSCTIALLAVIAGISACSLRNIERETMPDGTHRLTCHARLSLCLVEVQDACAEAGYDVLEAHEERKRAGPMPLETEIIRSQARIRCRKMTAVFGDSADEAETRPPPSSSAAPPSSSPPKVCAPGATQVCVGTGACQGGQRCLADGSGFGLCDCGPPAPATIPPENTDAPAAPPPSSAAPAGSAAPPPAPPLKATP